MAQVLGEMGARAAYVVHGADGTDELNHSGSTGLPICIRAPCKTYELDPQLGLARRRGRPAGGHAEANAAITREILGGASGAPSAMPWS